MKLGVISDLHMDDCPQGEVLDALVSVLKTEQPDALVIPGDIASSWRKSLAFLSELESACPLPIYFVPGNHDLWNRDSPGEDAKTAMAAFMKHPGCLSGRRVGLGAWTLVGETGWYDSSFAEGRFTAEEIALMSHGGRTWQDSLYTRWPEPMLERCALFHAALTASLEDLDPSRAIAVTHVVPRLEFTVRPPEGIWTYFNALLGSASYGELFSRKGLRAALFGHVHYRKRMVLDGVEWICACLGNRDEWREKDARAEVARSLAILDLGDPGQGKGFKL